MQRQRITANKKQEAQTGLKFWLPSQDIRRSTYSSSNEDGFSSSLIFEMNYDSVIENVGAWAKGSSKIDKLKEKNAQTMAALKEQFSKASDEDIKDKSFVADIKLEIGKAVVPSETWAAISGAVPKNKGGRGKKNTEIQNEIKAARRDVMQQVSRLYARLRDSIESRLPAMDAEESIFPELQEIPAAGDPSSSNSAQTLENPETSAQDDTAKAKRNRSQTIRLEATETAPKKQKKPTEPKEPVKPGPLVIHRQDGDYINLDDFLSLRDFNAKLQGEIRAQAADLAKLLFLANALGEDRKEYRIDKLPGMDGFPTIEFLSLQPKLIYGPEYKRK